MGPRRNGEQRRGAPRQSRRVEPLSTEHLHEEAVQGFQIWRRVLSAAIAAFLGLLTIAGIGSLGALAQTDVSFKEWTVPTKGSHPHDPLAAADGTIWYTGQMTSVLGRLNPRTGAFREYRTKTPESGPHGLAADQEGNIWFTGNFAGYIGKLDPNTGAVTEYHLPKRLAIRTRRCSMRREIFGSRYRART